MSEASVHTSAVQAVRVQVLRFAGYDLDTALVLAAKPADLSELIWWGPLVEGAVK